MLRLFPYEMMEHKRLPVVECSVNIVYELILGGRDGSTVYYFLNKMKPNLLTRFTALLTSPLTAQF